MPSPVGGVDYPRTWSEFVAWFPVEAACVAYLERLRWGDGFVCPGCGSTRCWSASRGLGSRVCAQCANCGKPHNGPTRPNPPFTTNTTHRPRTPIRPPGQPATTRRAPQHALRQLPLDLIRISLYHEDHDASGITQKGPPRPTAKKDERVLARTRTSSRRRTTHTPSSSLSMAKPHHRMVIQRGV